MSLTPRYRVFTSFQYEDLRYATLISAWSANENTDFSLYSERLRVAVDSTNADYVKGRIRPGIERASVLLCLIGTGTSGSSWVRWEIEYAKSKGKGLVGVMLASGNTKPTAIMNSGAIFVPYERDQMSRAIDWAATAGKTSGDFKL